MFSRAKNVQILFQKLHFSADSAFYIYRIIVYFTVIPTSVGALGAGGREFESRHSDQNKSHDDSVRKWRLRRGFICCINALKTLVCASFVRYWLKNC